MTALLALWSCAARDPRRVVPHLPPDSATAPEEVAVIPRWSGTRHDSTPASELAPAILWSASLGAPVTLPVEVSADVVIAVGTRLDAFGEGGVVVWSREGSPVATVAFADQIFVLDDAEFTQLAARTGGLTGGPTASVTLPVPTDVGLVWAAADGRLESTQGVEAPPLGRTMGDLVSDGHRVAQVTQDGLLRVAVPRGIAWTLGLPSPPVAGPVFVADLVVVATVDRVLAAGPEGTAAWSWDAPSRPVGLASWAGDVVVVGESGDVSLLDAETGRAQFGLQLAGALGTLPAIAGDLAIVGGPDGFVRAIDLREATPAWTFDVGSAVTGDPVSMHGIVFVGTADGRLVALGTPGTGYGGSPTRP